MFKNINEIQVALVELESILDREEESNWSKGVKAALLHIKSGTEDDYYSARSIYKTMCNGSAGFMEYYIKRDDFKEQEKANDKLDSVRDRLWDLFCC